MSDLFTIEYVKDPKWTSAEKNIFECIVKYAEFDFEMPVGVNPADPYAHIQELWTNGLNGDYGVIADYEPPPPPPIYIPTAEDNKQTAVLSLQQTDWTTVADVGDPALSNPYLANQAEFIAWRSQVRAIAVNPVAGILDIWSQMPNEIWQ